jgi:hypothetical protein
MEVIITNDRPHILERNNRVYFIESYRDSKRRVVNLEHCEYIEFVTVIQYEPKEKIFTARVQYQSARCHIFTDNDAYVLYEYFVTGSENIQSFD